MLTPFIYNKVFMTLSFLPELNPFFCILALASHRDGEVKRKENHLDVKKEVPTFAFHYFQYQFKRFSVIRLGGRPVQNLKSSMYSVLCEYIRRYPWFDASQANVNIRFYSVFNNKCLCWYRSQTTGKCWRH